MSAFDTHSGYQQLVEAGVPENQANAHVKILTTLVDERLVTRDFLRAELQELRQEMHDSDASLRREMQQQTASLRQEITESARRTRYWTTTVVIVCTGILSVIIAVT